MPETSVRSIISVIVIGEHRRTRIKFCPRDLLPTANPTCRRLKTNPGLRGKKPATNRLNHCTNLGVVK